MKLLKLCCCGLLLFSACAKKITQTEKSPLGASSDQKQSNINPSAAISGKWKLVFSDKFNSNGDFDSGKWTYCERNRSAWNKYLTSTSDYVYQKGGNLVLRMDNAKIAGDDVPYHSGGIQTSTKFSILYGKVEVRAKFTKGKGSWPAIWMMPERPTAYGGWPKAGKLTLWNM